MRSHPVPTMNRRSFQKTLLAGSLALGISRARGSVLAELQQRRRWDFDGVSFENMFSGARLSELLRVGEGHYLAISRPEVRPINPSPWYAFAVTSKKPRSIQITIRVDSSDDMEMPLKASRPWLSRDESDFSVLPVEAWDTQGIDRTARLDIPAGRLMVAAWKPVSLERVDSWIDRMTSLPFVSEQTIGLSREGRPVRELEIGEGVKKRTIVVLGGQHPPEITGNHGLEAFVEEICAGHATARQFRRSFRTLVIPMINPDGKHHGHWRCTTGGVDPNRDWFAQSQPEVRAVARHLARTRADGGTICFGIDFHSTNRDFVYVESPGVPDAISGFTRAWADRCASLPGGYQLDREPGRSMNPCSREWMATQLLCPSYTREFRYDQEEAEVRVKSRTEALAMMEVLLENG